MKKVIKILFLVFVVLLMNGCDDKPPTKRELEEWIDKTVVSKDNYKILKKEKTGSNFETKMKYTLKSQYGFKFYAIAWMTYYDGGSCGSLDAGYHTKFYSDYSIKFKDHHSSKVNALLNKYSNYLEPYEYEDGFYFHINNYSELTLLNDFSYDMYKILDFYSPKITIDFNGTVNDVDVDYSALSKDKKNHLADLRIYYIDLVQKQLVDDKTIPIRDNVTLNRFYINGKEIDPSENSVDSNYSIMYYNQKYNTYGVRLSYGRNNYDLLQFFIENLGYEYNKDINNKLITYQLGKDKYKIKYSFKKVKFKKNWQKLDIDALEQPIYDTFSYYRGEEDDYIFISLEDFSKLINCKYKIVENAIYFTC